MTDKDMLYIANPLMENIIQAAIQGNYENPTRDVTKRLKSIVTKETFEKQLSEHKLVGIDIKNY